MSEVNSEYIHRGFWIDWSKGRVLGATLTVDSTAGNIVIALVAVLLSLATNHLWNLVLFAIHLSRASRPRQSVIFHQQQAIIRTLPTPFLLFAQTAKIVWAWRKIVPAKSLFPMLVTSLMALLFGHAALVASVFSSYMIAVSNVHVLVSNVRCAVDIDWKYVSRTEPDWVPRTIRAGQSYADYCYSGDGVEPSACNVYATPQVALSRANISCPLNSSTLCVASNPTSIVLDSGLIDSDSVLGINARPADRIFFRKRTTYTPIEVEGRYTVLNRSQIAPFYRQRSILPDEQLYSFNYGQTEHTAALPGLNSTTYWSTSLSSLLLSYTAWADVSYASHPTDTSFVADPELRHPDADTGVIFIYGNNIQSSTPIDDPVFASHLPLYCDNRTYHDCSVVQSPNRSAVLYSADHPAGVVVALSQYQACLSDHSGKAIECTNLTSLLFDRVSDLLPLANEAQSIVLRFLSSLTYLYDLDYIQYIDNDASALEASRANEGGYQLGLPSDQWVTEATRWESTLWAALQISTAYHATGFGGNSPGYLTPRTKTETNFCASQKVSKPGGFANINVFGVLLCVCVSLILIIADVFALKLATHLSQTRWLSQTRVQEWIQDGVLQLQRCSYQAQDMESWDWVLHGTRSFELTTPEKQTVLEDSGSIARHESRCAEGASQTFIGRINLRSQSNTTSSQVTDGQQLTFSNTLDGEMSSKAPTTITQDEVTHSNLAALASPTSRFKSRTRFWRETRLIE